MTNLRYVLLTCALAVLASPLAAQNDWDTAGNNLLNGTYFYRDVIWVTDFAGSNNLDAAVANHPSVGEAACGFALSGSFHKYVPGSESSA